MEYRKTWRKRLLTAVGSAGLIVAGAAEVRAEMLYGSNVPAAASEADTPTVQFVPQGTVRLPTISHAREDWSALLRGLRGEWEGMREELTRTMLDATMTAFFIRSAPPPSVPPPPPPIALGVPPPQSQGNPPGPTILPAPPPPPQGSGDPGTINPPPPFNPGSPQGAPEPSSFVIALLGAGLVAGYGRRRRRVNG